MLFVSTAQIEDIDRLPEGVDGIEIRLDLINDEQLPLVKELIETSSYPIMLTIKQFRKVYLPLLKKEPPYCCIDWQKGVEQIISEHPNTRFILSYHNFEKMPPDLNALLYSMQKIPAAFYKIATYVHSAHEALQLLLFGKQHFNVSVHPMGERGSFARVLGPIVSNPFDFCSLDSKPLAPGQLDATVLLNTYRYKKLGRQTALFGLIGDPVKQSIGHIYHNQKFEEEGINAVYVKIPLSKEELPHFLPLAQEIGFQGLSVTMPLKEAIVPYLETKTDAVNTVCIDTCLNGSNTDGSGALDAIEKRALVQGKTLVILGAGGTARAIAHEAMQRGADVWIFNRTEGKAENLATSLGCKWGKWLELPSHYDALISCIPDASSLEPDQLLSSAIVLDCVYYPTNTPLLMQAKQKGCQIIYGQEMFENQAQRQSELWLETMQCKH